MNNSTAYGAPGNPAGPAPLRRPGSIRRTQMLDTIWPDGRLGSTVVAGLGRDLFTPLDGYPARTLVEQRLDVVVSPVRVLEALGTTPAHPGLQALVGVRAGGHLRKALDMALGGEAHVSTPLHLMLDDLSGATLVSGWAWSHWMDGWHDHAKTEPASKLAGRNGQMADVCIGFALGSSAFKIDGEIREPENGVLVGSVVNRDDIDGWAALPEQSRVSMRRARRIDVWLDGTLIHIHSYFQDSATLPEGGRRAVHEYLLEMTADAATGEIRSVLADPRILPYPECPAAAGNVTRLVGTHVADLRKTVLARLKGTAGCTHLNDALRMLAAVPRLVDELRQPA